MNQRDESGIRWAGMMGALIVGLVGAVVPGGNAYALSCSEVRELLDTGVPTLVIATSMARGSGNPADVNALLDCASGRTE